MFNDPVGKHVMLGTLCAQQNDAVGKYAMLGPSCAQQTVVRSLVTAGLNISCLVILQVLVDGLDVRDMDLHELRRQVGLVSQEPILFSCTVRDNICYANPEASQQQVEDAARAANAHSFVERLPEGYSTQVNCSTIQILLQHQQWKLLQHSCSWKLYSGCKNCCDNSCYQPGLSVPSCRL